jgi:hypothetical protein
VCGALATHTLKQRSCLLASTCAWTSHKTGRAYCADLAINLLISFILHASRLVDCSAVIHTKVVGASCFLKLAGAEVPERGGTSSWAAEVLAVRRLQNFLHAIHFLFPFLRVSLCPCYSACYSAAGLPYSIVLVSSPVSFTLGLLGAAIVAASCLLYSCVRAPPAPRSPDDWAPVIGCRVRLSRAHLCETLWPGVRSASLLLW